MATTTRRKNKENKEKRSEEVLPPIPSLKPEIKEVLEPDHFRKLEVGGLELESSRLEMAVEEQNLKNLTLALENLSMKIEKQKTHLYNLAQRYELTKAKYTNFKREIFPMYGLKENDKLAYDRNSGKIIKD